MKLPSHSYQKRKSTVGSCEHLWKLEPCLEGNTKTFSVISVILSPLSQITFPNVDCLICVSCSGLNVAALSYQNLKSKCSIICLLLLANVIKY